MQEAEIDAVPLPLHAGKAGAHAGDADSVGRVRDRHRIRAAHGLEPAGVVVVAVADDRRVQPPYAQRTPRGHADALAGVETVPPPGAPVVQQAVAGRAEERRVGEGWVGTGRDWGWPE